MFSKELEAVTFVNVGWLIDGHWEHEGDMGVRKVRRVKNQGMTFKCATKRVGLHVIWTPVRSVLK